MATIVAGLTLAPLANATIPDTNGVIHGCYLSVGGFMRVIDGAAQSCLPIETPISWGAAGPPGPPGYTADPFPGSKILDQADAQKVSRWTADPLALWKLCYRRSDNGATSATFHQFCDNRGASVTVISMDGGSRVLGAIAHNGWSSSGSYASEIDSLLYSLTSGKEYPLSQQGAQYATFNATTYGPIFGGGHDLYVSSDMTTAYCKFPYAYAWHGQTQNPTSTAETEFCGSYNSWMIDELAVWVQADAEDAGWRVEVPKRGYWKLKCPCGLHYHSVSLTPSNPAYDKNLRSWLHRQDCWRKPPS